ncbi:hypothetical protein PWT90_11221 [Aphanocladium album]|nr:hypothetical protein PWT90_11221 [Aphanocladium album]
MEDEPCSALSPQREDSGYESAELSEEDAPGVEMPGEFVFHGTMAFVTYSRSRVKDPKDFHRYLRESLERHLPKVGGPGGGRGTVEIFGSKELHEDGTPHYHVMLRFEPRVHWRRAREYFGVMIDVDGNAEVDTTSIYIRKRAEDESPEVFLQSVQAYIAKEGDVFGEWIGPRESAAKRAQKDLQVLIAMENRDEAEAFLKEKFPRQYVFNQNNVVAFLNTKKPALALEHVPNFIPRAWDPTGKMKQWLSRNFGPNRTGRPYPLVLEGESRSGKTEWSLSWGRPANMSGGWNMDELTKPGITHIVLNDIDWKTFPNKRDLAGCQRAAAVF